MALWSAIINSALGGKSSENEENFVLSDEDKEKIVNEVLESISESEASDTGEKFELINTVTFTEDSRLAVFNKDLNGEPFELKKYVGTLRVKPSDNTEINNSAGIVASFSPNDELTTSSTRLNVYSSAVSAGTIFYGMAGGEVYLIEEKTTDKGRMALIHGIPGASINVATKIPEGVKGICQIGIATLSDMCYFGPGTVFDLYGVRA